jgi:hypothetical protein
MKRIFSLQVTMAETDNNRFHPVLEGETFADCYDLAWHIYAYSRNSAKRFKIVHTY